jgi:hypothetical protein
VATIKLGAIASDIRGSIGGTVFSRNGGGAYAKARTKGTDPNTALQQVMRGIMSGMIGAWAALTAAVRADWAVYARQVPFINRLGDAINLSGYNMFVRTKSICELIGATMPAAAPTVMYLSETDPTVVITPDASSKNVSVAFDNTLPWAGEVGGHLLCYQGLPQSATRNSYSGPFLYAGKVNGAATPVTSPATVALPYTMAAGQKCFMQFRTMRADGRLSSPFRITGTVQA